MARRFHLFPFRTEKLSFATPMVLRTSGRVGSRRFREAPRQKCSGAFFVPVRERETAGGPVRYGVPVFPRFLHGTLRKCGLPRGGRKLQRRFSEYVLSWRSQMRSVCRADTIFRLQADIFPYTAAIGRLERNLRLSFLFLIKIVCMEI